MDHKNFHDWLDQFIKETEHQFGFQLFVETVDGEVFYRGDDDYREWYDGKLQEYNKLMNTTPEVPATKEFTLTYDQLHQLLSEAYRSGHASYEMTESGLEPYDADGYARWKLLGME